MNWNDPPELDVHASQDTNPSLFKRLVDVFVNPGQAMEAVASQPRWLGAMLLAMAVSLLGVLPHVDGLTEMGLEQLRAQPNWDESTAGAVEVVTKVSIFVGASVGVFFLSILATLFYWLVFRILGDGGGFKQWFAAVVHALFLGRVVDGLAGIVIGTEGVLRGGLSVGTLVGSGLGEGFLLSLLNALTLSSIWGAVVLAIGARALSRGKRSMGSALLVSGIILLIATAVSARIAMFGGMGAG